MTPICPVCGEPLEYDEQVEAYYNEDTFSNKWRGHCDNCQIDFTWWENYNLISITDMKQEEELE